MASLVEGPLRLLETLVASKSAREGVSCVRIVPSLSSALGRYRVVTTRPVHAGSLLHIDTAVAMQTHVLVGHEDDELRAATAHCAERLDDALVSFLRDCFPGDERAQRAYLANFAPYDEQQPTIAQRALAVCDANAYPMPVAASRQKFGFGFFPSLARCNHCCRPNASYFAHGEHMFLVARVDLAAETEVTLQYALGTEHIRDRERRRELLRGAMHFECQCTVCAAGPFTLPETEIFYKVARWSFASLSRVPALNVTATVAAVDVSEGLDLAYRMSIAFLRAHAAEITPDERDLVVDKCVALLIPAHMDGVLPVLDKWCELASEFVKLLDSSNGSAHVHALWYGVFFTMRYLAVLKTKHIALAQSNLAMPGETALLAAAQYFEICKAGLLHSILEQILAQLCSVSH